MEASEAIRRIFWRYRWLLFFLLIVPAVGVAGVRELQPVAYSASASVQGQGTTPDAQVQVSAIQSRVTAMATDPATVRQAITAADVTRDSASVARGDISVSPLGTSAVMVLTVTDRSRQVAVRLAGSLARAVVSKLNQLGVEDNPELSQLNTSIQQLTNRRDNLVSQLNGVVTADEGRFTSGRGQSLLAQSLLAQLSATEQEMATEESSSQQILGTVSASTGASVLATPSSATEAPRNALTYGALAALLGLVLGLLFASLREIMRPTIAQAAAGARELGTIPLGTAIVEGGRIIGTGDIAGRLSLTAQRAGAGTIVLTGPCTRARLAALAVALNRDLPGGQHHGNGKNGAAPCMRVTALPDIGPGEQPANSALVVVLPAFAAAKSLDEAADLSAATDWPVLGVIELRVQRARRDADGDAAPGRDGAAGDDTEMERTHD